MMLYRSTVSAVRSATVLVAIFTLSAGGAVNASTQLPQDFTGLAQQCAPSVSPKTLAHLVAHESSGNPYAIGLNDRRFRLPRQPKTKGEAIAAAEWLYQRGYSFGSGWGQIDSQHVKPRKLKFETLFDPCENLRLSSEFLGDCYTRAVKAGNPDGQAALRHALSCYNTGNFSAGIKNGYVDLVAAASPDTLAVPALEPSQVSGGEPIKLKAVQSNTARSAPIPPTPEGVPDAFSGTPGDAFYARPPDATSGKVDKEGDQ